MPSLSELLAHPLTWTVLTIVVVMAVFLNTVAYLVMLERKVSAWMQDRIGPNRVGPKGLLQPIVDGIKMVLKEDIVPTHVDKVFYILAPMMAAGTALLAFAVVPFGYTTPPPGPVPPGSGAAAQVMQEQAEYRARYQSVIAPGVDIGILFTFAVTSLAVYGIVLGGWSSNNKYSMLGALRSSAQLISYEIPLGMSVLGIVLISGSLNLERVVQYQVDHGWFIFYQPLAFLLFLTGVFAECNRLPFDLPEAEQELVGGYHTEYSSLKFGLFFLGEYTHMLTTSFLLAVVFLGGWHFPFSGAVPDGVLKWVLGLVVMLIKVAFFIMVYMVVRWTIPRFRFDQLMGLAWQVLIPLAALNLLCVMVVKELDVTLWLLLPASVALLVGGAWLASRPISGRTPPPDAPPAAEVEEMAGAGG
jgi:NADH-quinone oxidoreductase subunit H